MKISSIVPVIDLTFWQKAYYYKLEKLKLSEEEVSIYGTSKFSKFNQNDLRLQFDGQSLDQQEFVLKFDTFSEIQIPGILKIINKKTEFDEHVNKLPQYYKSFKDKNNSTPYYFLILYIDHKKFDYEYSFYEIRHVENFQQLIEDAEVNCKEKFELNTDNLKSSNGIVLNQQKLLFGDTTIGSVISKFLLNYISINHTDIQELNLMKTPLILKEDQVDKEQEFNIAKFKLIKDKKILDVPKFRCKNKKVSISLKSFLNKETIIENQSQLNLKLMKWRLEPKLDLDMLSNLKVFILGTGTLGCNLARLLVGYGIKHITFLDNGSVSYSNLARQSLFNMENFDEHEKGIPKVQAAKQNLLKISPFAEIRTLNMSMPMPGHFINEDQIDPILQDLQILEEEIKNHDVLLNCFDSREARYFPTLIGALYNKTVMSIGIGYDSFVIVNHGKYEQDFKIELEKSEQVTDIEELTKKNNVGCFFCSDYLPPSDTISNRSLDQQCTVSRPGISMISSGIGLEMLINYLHNQKIGPSPFFIRGVFGSQFEVNQYDNSRYNNCTACSPYVIKEFVKNRKNFLLAVLNNPDLINKFSGFNEVMGDIDDDDTDNIIILDNGFEEITNKKK